MFTDQCLIIRTIRGVTVAPSAVREIEAAT